MIHRSVFFTIATILLCAPAVLLAATSNFTIQTQIINDFSPPTTPTLLTVVPIAPSQINVTWSASTDDVAVAGYRLFRNAIQIATTTLLTYSDTGLVASTTYSYTVDAFDAIGNLSSTSLPLATTTPPSPIIATSSATSSSGSSGTRIKPTLQTLNISTTQTTALFTWQTTSLTQYTLVWGRTSSYELGSVSGNIFKDSHVTNLTNLEPGTKYYYELRATDVRGVTDVLGRDTFITERSVLSDQLPNVRSFTAQTLGSDVLLSWTHSFSDTNQYVRVVRSHLSYPTTIDSGAAVYEGRAKSFIDANALSVRSPQYYTIFVLDRNGNISSGAVAKASKQDVPATNSNATSSGTTPPSTIPPDVGDDTVLKASAITIAQLEKIQWFDTDMELSSAVPFLISIPYSAVAKNLKSIIVSVQNPTDQRAVSAYLLKLNPAGDAYTAYIPGPEIVGRSGITVEVFDYEQATVRRISTHVTFVDTQVTVPLFPDRLFEYIVYGLMTGILICLSWGLFIPLRKRRQKDS